MTHDSWLMTHDSWLMTQLLYRKSDGAYLDESWPMTHDSWLSLHVWNTAGGFKSHVTHMAHLIMSHATHMTHLNELSVILDRTSNNYDCRNFKQDFMGAPITLQQAFTGFPKIQAGFHRSNRESPSLKRVDWKTVQSGDPNIFSRISSVSSWASWSKIK